MRIRHAPLEIRNRSCAGSDFNSWPDQGRRLSRSPWSVVGGATLSTFCSSSRWLVLLRNSKERSRSCLRLWVVSRHVALSDCEVLRVDLTLDPVARLKRFSLSGSLSKYVLPCDIFPQPTTNSLLDQRIDTKLDLQIHYEGMSLVGFLQ